MNGLEDHKCLGAELAVGHAAADERRSERTRVKPHRLPPPALVAVAQVVTCLAASLVSRDLRDGALRSLLVLGFVVAVPSLGVVAAFLADRQNVARQLIPAALVAGVNLTFVPIDTALDGSTQPSILIGGLGVAVFLGASFGGWVTSRALGTRAF